MTSVTHPGGANEAKGTHRIGPRIGDARGRARFRAAGKGASPADLPVQALDRFSLLINMKTAKAVGGFIPQAVLVRADEVIR